MGIGAALPGPMPDLIVVDRPTIQAIMARSINDAGKCLHILEAGCGRRWPFEKGDHTITGIDMDQHALDFRQKQKKDLDVAVLGDLREVQLAPASFDVIYSAFVLEHVDDAEKVLDNFVLWLKPGGLLMLTFPDRDGVYGFFTRITPFWFHVLYKRYVEGIKNAGKPGFVPYETFHDQVISRRSFLEYAAANGLSAREEYGFGHVPKSVWAFIKLVGLLSFGKLASDHINLMYVLQKRV